VRCEGCDSRTAATVRIGLRPLRRSPPHVWYRSIVASPFSFRHRCGTERRTPPFGASRLRGPTAALVERQVPALLGARTPHPLPDGTSCTSCRCHTSTD